MQVTKSLVVKALYIIAISLVMYAHSSVDTGSCGEKFSTRLDQDVFSKHRLRSRVVDSQPINRPFECYVKCMKNCRCLSYNVCNGGKLCELNSEKKENNISLYEQSDECDYHEYQFTKQSSSGCQDPCCSTSQPCVNGGRCEAVCMMNNKRFQCVCPAGYVGDRCEKKAKSCEDFNRDSNRASGLRVVHSQSGTLYSLYCFFNSWSAQTLVLSYARKTFPDLGAMNLPDNYPFAENSPNWTKYRLSKSRMVDINNAATQWAVSCSYDTQGMRTDEDYLRVLKSNLDPLNAKSGIRCPQVRVARLKGEGCDNCVVAMGGGNTGVVMKKVHASHCEGSVQVVPSMTCSGRLPSYFGGYNAGCFDEDFSCSSSDNATTQLWFIHFL